MTDSIHVRGEGGTVFEMTLPLPDSIAKRLADGALTRVNADGSPFQPPAEADPYAVKRPGDKALKGDWVTYAVSRGMSVNEATGHSKADLIAKFPADDGPDPDDPDGDDQDDEDDGDEG